MKNVLSGILVCCLLELILVFSSCSPKYGCFYSNNTSTEKCDYVCPEEVKG